MSLFAMLIAAAVRNSVPAVGQAMFGATGTSDSVYSWAVPEGVTSIHAVVVGGSGNVVSSIKRGATTLLASNSATSSAIGGGNGGGSGANGGGGGGAGGYTGNGGPGGTDGNSGAAGAGGGGGGGGGGSTGGGAQSQTGGGVGLRGQDTSGAASGGYDRVGKPGSLPGPVCGAGRDQAAGGTLRYTITAIAVSPGETLTVTAARRPTTGAGHIASGGGVRIMWGGSRSYPSNAADMFAGTCYRLYITAVASVTAGLFEIREAVFQTSAGATIPGTWHASSCDNDATKWADKLNDGSSATFRSGGDGLPVVLTFVPSSTELPDRVLLTNLSASLYVKDMQIQRSADGVNWTTTATVTGAAGGSIGQVNTYSTNF